MVIVRTSRFSLSIMALVSATSEKLIMLYFPHCKQHFKLSPERLSRRLRAAPKVSNFFHTFRPCRSPERQREEKYAEAFSPMRSQVLGPSRGTSTGVKNLVSTRFFTLPLCASSRSLYRSFISCASGQKSPLSGSGSERRSSLLRSWQVHPRSRRKACRAQ